MLGARTLGDRRLANRLREVSLSLVLAATMWAGLAGTVAVQAREAVKESAKETAKESVKEAATARSVSLAALPAEARAIHRTIHSGGPFRYAKDGTVFGNRERLLPRHARGYYREYTVPTPGASHRGARRMVCGGQVPVAPNACYYTDDHYASFRLIAQ